MTDNSLGENRPRRVHAATKYPFHELDHVGDYFIIAAASKHKAAVMKKRYSIGSALRNYNKKNSTGIKVKTEMTDKGLIVERIE